MQMRIWLLLLVGPALAVFGRDAEAQQAPIPDGVFYYAPASTVFGPDAIWTNPAALGRYKSSAYALAADIADGSFARSWGAVVTSNGGGWAYRYVENPDGPAYREYVFAGGVPLGKMLSIGGSYRHFAGGPTPYNERHYWNLAVTSQGEGPFSLAAVLSNLNRSDVFGEESDIIQRYSAAYRPQGNVVTLAVDALSTTVQNSDDWTYVYHAQVAATTGLFIEGFLDSESNFEIGVRANLLKYFVGLQSHYDDEPDHKRTHIYVGHTQTRQPSLLRERGRRLSTEVAGRPSENPVHYVLGGEATAFADLVLGIWRAAEDRSISEMVLTLDNVRLSLAQAQELREAMLLFRRSGKPIVCHLSDPNNIGYYVASAATTVLIPPVSQLNLIGLRAELTFFAGTLSKLGIEVDVMRIGDYKTAAEALTRDAASEENRAMTNRLLDNLYAQFVAGIAEGRAMTADSVLALINRGPFTAQEALESGLVDGLSYRDRLAEDKFLSKMPEVSFRRYLADTLANDGWPRRPEIAVVVAEGEITDGSARLNPLDRGEAVTPELMKGAFAAAQADRDTRGIVFRVNSPGGLALAGDEIYHEAEKAREQQPIVVSMGGVAASGGYYISMAGHRIMADPATVTGSIGIFGGKAVLAGLFEKIDLGRELFTRGQNAGMLSVVRPFTDSERAKYFDHLKTFYDHFVGLVAANREIAADSIDQLGRGRVWTGREALDNGLVDELGGLPQAIAAAAAMAGVDDYRVVRYPQRRSLIALPRLPLIGALTRAFGLGDDPETGGDPVNSLPEGDLFARLPYDLDIR